MDISIQDYQKFKTILEQKSGIMLGDRKQYLVASRLSGFVKEEGFGNLSALIKAIESPTGSRTLKSVVERMTTHETLWFRDSYPFDYLNSTIIPEKTKLGGGLKIWSAACSSGQEPYSIAMQLDKANILQRSQITATDLSDKVVQKAKQGVYQSLELKRGLPDDKLKKYFAKVDEDNWQVSDAIKRKVNFQAANLLNVPYRLGSFDVIFCRNVLIYFSQENKSLVLNGLVQCLNPGGYLFLGASEALTRDITDLEMIRCQPGLVYRKSN